jgi:hypothetical protein
MQASFSFFTFICSTESSIAKGTAVKSVNFDLEIFEAFFHFHKRFLFMHLTYLLLQAKKEEVFDGSCPGDRGSSRAPLSTDASGFSGSKVHIASCGGAHVSIL